MVDKEKTEKTKKKERKKERGTHLVQPLIRNVVWEGLKDGGGVGKGDVFEETPKPSVLSLNRTKRKALIERRRRSGLLKKGVSERKGSRKVEDKRRGGGGGGRRRRRRRDFNQKLPTIRSLEKEIA